MEKKVSSEGFPAVSSQRIIAPEAMGNQRIQMKVDDVYVLTQGHRVGSDVRSRHDHNVSRRCGSLQEQVSTEADVCSNQQRTLPALDFSIEHEYPQKQAEQQHDGELKQDHALRYLNRNQ